ncbi:helicase-associated domain-containing protein [Streptomyces sp. WMMC905]|uniref:helicase-associated domain-containing protein n=1 Tax=Streptomyces sp. WMMC905 TaxID=3404123 RepID=UPI003B954404
MSTEDKPPAPRSLAEDLRARDDASLAALLRARPDLVTPVPTDLTDLATRAGTRASVVRALERLDLFALQTAQALAVASDPATFGELLGLMAGDDPDPEVATALPRARAVLHERALLWGGDDRLRLVRTARELLAPAARRPSPTGLGPDVREAAAGMSPGRVQTLLATAGLPATHDSVSAVTELTALFRDRKRMARLLAALPPDSREVLDRLAWGPPYGQITADPAPRLRLLLDRGLLLPTAPGTVVLPREVALHLRGGRAHREPRPSAPPVTAARSHPPPSADGAAAGQALAALGAVEELLRGWDEGGPAVLRAGGLSVRELRRTAADLEVSEPVAAFWLESAYGAGLLAPDGAEDEHYAATPAYDAWRELPAARRWALLADAWLTSTRTPGLVGGEDARDRGHTALGPGLDRSAAPEVRRRVLTLLADLPEGAAADTEAVTARLRWERPRREDDDDLRTRLARWALLEAELLGVTGRGALSTHGRALIGCPASPPGGTARTAGGTDGRPPARRTARGSTPVPPGGAVGEAAEEAARLLAPLLPEPLDHVLLQADLTAVAPGPLESGLAQLLRVAADVESTGGATVYRFTPGSVRRALDSGRTAEELHAFLAAHARTPVPQPLTYLIDDVARRHGRLRVGAASAYVRCDDDATVREILADRRAAGLGLRSLAPTVLAARADPASLLEGLRAMGFAPAAESAEGDVVVARAERRRTPPRAAPRPVVDGPPVPDEALLAATVRALRADVGPRRAEAAGGAEGVAPRTDAADTLAAVQAAALTGGTLWIGHVDAGGIATRRLVAPVRVEGGFATVFDHTADEVRTYPLHRITGVAEAQAPPRDGAD